jgi:hypothetical protein
VVLLQKQREELKWKLWILFKIVSGSISSMTAIPDFDSEGDCRFSGNRLVSNDSKDQWEESSGHVPVEDKGGHATARDHALLRFASAPSLFSDDVPNVLARDRINHRRYQFIWSGGVAALRFTNVFYGLVL